MCKPVMFNCLVTWCLFSEQFFAGIANKLAIANWNTTESWVLVQFRFRNVICSRGPLNFFRLLLSTTHLSGHLPKEMVVIIFYYQWLWSGALLLWYMLSRKVFLIERRKIQTWCSQKKVIKFKWYPFFVSVMSMLRNFVFTQIQIYLNLQTCSCPQSER